MSVDRCIELPASDEATRLARIALDIAEMNATPARPGWSEWDLVKRHATCCLIGTAYVVRLVRTRRRREEFTLWFWGRAGRADGQRAESLEAAQQAAEIAAAIDAAGREL